MNLNTDKISIIYNEFKNVAVQKSVIEDYLPIIKSNDGEDENSKSSNTNFIFEPDKSKLSIILYLKLLRLSYLKLFLNQVLLNRVQE